MKELTVKVYRFTELSEKVQDMLAEAKRDAVHNLMMEVNDRERYETLEAFCKAFDVDFDWEGSNYFVPEFNYHMHSDMYDANNDDINAEAVHGKLLFRWINNHSDALFPKRKFYKMGGSRTSSILCTDDDNCPLTGTCYDYDILKPMYDRYDKVLSPTYSLNNLIHDCLDSFFRSWHEEDEYWHDNMDAIKEELSQGLYADTWFFEDGSIFNSDVEE